MSLGAYSHDSIITGATHIILVQKHVQLLGADSQISFVELVRNIPSEGSKLPSLLDQSVEETEPEEHLLEVS